MDIPWQSLPPETLRNIVEEFVTREGTDYGEVAHSLEDKVASVLRQLERGEVLITFDDESGTVSLVTRTERLHGGADNR